MARYLVLLAGVLLLASCTKEYSFEGEPLITPEEIPLSYIRCTIDGEPKSFDVYAKGTSQQAGGQHVLSIFGKATPDAENVERFNMGISSYEPILAGSYSENGGGILYVVNAVYNPDNPTDTWAVGSQPSNAAPFTITITSISSTEVRGTFSGNLMDNNGLGTVVKQVRDGEFVVPL